MPKRQGHSLKRGINKSKCIEHLLLFVTTPSFVCILAAPKLVLQPVFALAAQSATGRLDFTFESPAVKVTKKEVILLDDLFFGDPLEIRTPDTLLKRQVLCRLS